MTYKTKPLMRRSRVVPAHISLVIVSTIWVIALYFIAHNLPQQIGINNAHGVFYFKEQVPKVYGQNTS